jgi:hypothetical protein
MNTIIFPAQGLPNTHTTCIYTRTNTCRLPCGEQDEDDISTVVFPSDADSDEVAKRMYEYHGGRTSISASVKAVEKEERVNDLCAALDQQLLMTARKMRWVVCACIRAYVCMYVCIGRP